ncbi:TonB-dependent receptor [Sphingomonas nostoxanthinifaciens]|uniref:TonB-dependent receptor n=1 Tax=Sphingomonas nostoxanthinifaciens TaxID=2872652 RepID=UPI001CC1DD1B|nr:TonB-dependent receptor [Sphingomonas nostoxanthinifaciens]
MVAALGAQTGTTITVPDPGVAARHSSGVRVVLQLRAALAQALSGADAEAVFYDSRTVRIVARRPPPPPPFRVAPALAPEPSPEIIVTASKQALTRDTYPGSVTLTQLSPGWTTSHAGEGTAAIIRLLPTLASTNLGPGRNKLFIRGIADSSFNGPTQSTVGQYLGDVRLTYNAPDPDLNLYDMKRVEVLVGPQGTLYGAGSLGGVIRLVPNSPDLSAFSTTMSAGVSATQAGGIGRDGAGTLNIPLLDGRLGVRFVVFGTRQAGYIDDPSRAPANINNTLSYGERFSLRAALADWTIDLGFVAQNITDQDGQYVVRGDPPLTRAEAIAQPFHNDYRLGYITVRHPVGAGELVSTTSVARHDLTTVFDATAQDGNSAPARFEEANDITLISHETRLSGGGGRAPWVGGVTALFSSSMLSRTLGPLAEQQRIAGVVNIQAEAALFGQMSRPLGRTLTGTIGGRITFANSTGILINEKAALGEHSSRDTLRFSSTLALDWHPGGPLSAFFHYQQGYRAGGLAVAPSGSGIASQRFTTDALNMNELGLRLGDEARDHLSLRAALFYADWNDIQADLVDSAGLPYTSNVGRGRLFGLDGQFTWQLSPGLTLRMAAFLNDSRLVRPAAAFATSGEQSLPNIAHGGARISLDWRREISDRANLSGSFSVRYVGKSRLGVGPYLDIPQGGYAVTAAGVRVDFAQVGVALDLNNLANIRANSFAFGNPFTVGERDQMTPLKPRTIRLGLNARF